MILIYLIAYYVACLLCVVPALHVVRVSNTVELLIVFATAPLVLIWWLIRRAPATVTIGGLILLAIALSGCGHDNHAEAEISQAHYCDMVAMYRQSGGERGWPAYRGSVGDRECARLHRSRANLANTGDE